MKFLPLLLLLFFIVGCDFFEKQERLLSKHVKGNGVKVRIYYVELGATTDDVIQVRKSDVDTPLVVFKKYNFLKSSQLINDTSLKLLLSDTGYNNRYIIDTIFVSVK